MEGVGIYKIFGTCWLLFFFFFFLWRESRLQTYSLIGMCTLEMVVLRNTSPN